MKRRKTELEEKRELLWLVQKMDSYQVRLVLAFITTLFGLEEEEGEMKKAA